jgi:hypothetical protein
MKYRPGEIIYCADCDLTREANADGADSEAERVELLNVRPRVVAETDDIDGTPLCRRCLDYRRTDRHLDYLERKFDPIGNA